MEKGDKIIFYENLGDGKVIEIESGETIFRLDSNEKNPIVKPQEIGLTWKENGKLRIGAVFNGGAEFFEDQVILLPRCHRNYRKGKFFDEKLGLERDCLENYTSEVWPLTSSDGINFTRFQNLAIRGDGTDHQDFAHGIEDIRIIKYKNSYVGRDKALLFPALLVSIACNVPYAGLRL